MTEQRGITKVHLTWFSFFCNAGCWWLAAASLADSSTSYQYAKEMFLSKAPITMICLQNKLRYGHLAEFFVDKAAEEKGELWRG